MATTYYYSIDGQILGQQVLGEAEGKDYLLDASGNLVGVYQGDYLKADASYDAFGNILDSWNISFYNFTWGGGHGYRQTGLAYSSVYVRARHYSNLDAGWTTRDPLWPSEMPYGYVNGRVPAGVDPSGMKLPWWMDPFTRGIPVVEPGPAKGMPQINIPPVVPRFPKIPRLNDDLDCFLRSTIANRTMPFKSNIFPKEIPQKYEDGWQPGDFNYGNHCGFFANVSSNTVIDSLDEACKQHDKCLATYVQVLTPRCMKNCNLELCQKLANASCNVYSGIRKCICERARIKMMALFCPLGALSGLNPLSWLPKGGSGTPNSPPHYVPPTTIFEDPSMTGGQDPATGFWK